MLKISSPFLNRLDSFFLVVFILLFSCYQLECQTLVKEGFESPLDTSTWHASGVNSGFGYASLSTEQAFEGAKSLKVLLKRDTIRKPVRAELRPGQTTKNNDFRSLRFKIGEEWWYSMSIYIPENWEYDLENTHEIFFQISPVSSDSKPPAGQALRLGLGGSHWEIYSRHGVLEKMLKKGVEKADKSKTTNNRLYYEPVKERGQWTTFKFHVVWSDQGVGALLEVWKDDNQIVSYTGPNCYVNRQLQMKFGIYKAQWYSKKTNVHERMLYFDEIEVAKGSRLE